MKRLFAILLAFISIVLTVQAQPPVPEFRLWLDCIERGAYPGRAVANISYNYAGEAPITAEDSRYFGDTQTGDTEVFDFRILPGEHPNDTRINVGALKVVLWKVVLFGKLYIVTAWDNPEIPDCAFLPEITPVATEQPNL